jgi:taspase, threonine aspartase, 1
MGLVACHTGAGNNVNEDNYRTLCKKASAKGLQFLQQGNSVLDSVEMTIKILEDNHMTNAGTGSNLTWDGTVECEAGIMESTNNNFGSCSCVDDVKNPISLARKICDKQNVPLKFGRIAPLYLSGNH